MAKGSFVSGNEVKQAPGRLRTSSGSLEKGSSYSGYDPARYLKNKQKQLAWNEAYRKSVRKRYR